MKRIRIIERYKKIRNRKRSKSEKHEKKEIDVQR
jgi:hypothetical protein